ncbi:MAG: 2-oxoglutarate dehydrogenase complex dihydrolipoyllysine-residue succinyltransferase [Trueperaceae bacterium]|nr:2-oxoglutarate dehydrogenase complex dihydrolipoyllysine-residue succinyltransferase [Trueperaceae bacterium]
MADLTVPSAGESINEVFIGTWLKKEGESVAVDEPVVEVETDKATLEIPSPVAGVVKKIMKAAGESAAIGEVIAQIEEGAEAAKSEPEAEAKEAPKAEPQAQAETEGPIMPAAQRLIDEHKLEASKIQGTGPGGRVLKEDVQSYLDKGSKSETTESKSETKEAKAPAQTPEPVGERQEETVPMSPLRRTIARRLVEAQQTAALLTTFNEIDMSAVMELRNDYKDAFEKRYGIRLGFMSFFVKAAVDALKLVPEINAEIRENSIVYKNYYDIAVAVSTPKGLVTPVIRNAERLSFAELESTIADFGKRAQASKLTPDELTGGTFTISNGGVFGSLMSTPIVNPPQSGVLGMHSIQERPVALNGQVVIRPMMYVALSYDHRIVDGRGAVTFLKRIKDAVESPARMLIEI